MACRDLAQRHTVDRMVDGYLEHYRRLLPAGVTVPTVTSSTMLPERSLPPLLDG